MNRSALPIIDVNFPKPPMGNNILCVKEHGVFVLEKKESVVQGVMCTHAGSGSVAIYDGIPLPNGMFPDEGMPIDHPDYPKSNGRLLWVASPSIMGMFMAGGWAYHGLTLVSIGANSAISPTVMVTWIPYTPPGRRIVNESSPRS